MADNDDDGLWEKPAWAKGGVKLKSTGKAEKMKGDGNLAAPITFTPYKNEDHSNTLVSIIHQIKLTSTSKTNKQT